jgi:hypothetical protein
MYVFVCSSFNFCNDGIYIGMSWIETWIKMGMNDLRALVVKYVSTDVQAYTPGGKIASSSMYNLRLW